MRIPNSQVVEVEQAGPAQVQGFLEAAEYPLSKNRLIDAARQADAPPEVLRSLGLLPDRVYASPGEVSDALAEVQFGLDIDRGRLDHDEHGLVLGPEDEGEDPQEV